MVNRHNGLPVAMGDTEAAAMARRMNDWQRDSF
jgi:hypothetical protein